MARDGYMIFDSDTHVGPYMDMLESYLAAEDKHRLNDWAQHKSVNKNGHATYNKGQRHYTRRLGSTDTIESKGTYMAGFTGVKRDRDPSPFVDHDPAARIKDMDFEGVDVNLTFLPAGSVPGRQATIRRSRQRCMLHIIDGWMIIAALILSASAA